MSHFTNILIIVLAWVFSIVNTSGMGIFYKTPEKTNYFIILWFLYVFLKKGQKMKIGGGHTALTIFTIISFVALPVFTADSWDGFSYLMMLPLLYCVSQWKISHIDIQISCYIVAGLGIYTLYIYGKTDILSGWNDNQIAMIGLFSYLYYAISLFGKRSIRKITIGLALTIIYTLLLTQETESRSTAIFISISLFFAYFGQFSHKIIRKRNFTFFALSIPLAIAIAITTFPQLEIFQAFNQWSEQNYGKSAFNGRDEIWLYTFKHLSETYYIGDGKFIINHHNSAMATLGVFGIIGYICWYKLLTIPIRKMTNYASDDIVYGCLMSFLLIFWQQSFDLGFVAASPNLIPYMILGIGLGRINTIQLYGKN